MKKILFILIFLLVGCQKQLGANVSVQPIPLEIQNIPVSDKVAEIRGWKNKKPKDDTEWAEDVKKESLNLKRDDELVQMRDSLIDKLNNRILPEYNRIMKYPDILRSQLEDRGFIGQEFDNEFQSEINRKFWEVEKIQQSIERINKEIELRDTKKVDRKDEIK